MGTDSIKGLLTRQAVADFNNTVILTEKPTLEASFPLDKSRFTAIIPPNVENPTFTLRKRSSRVILLEEYVESGAMTQLQLADDKILSIFSLAFSI